jgi:carbonic anhydrase
VENGWTGECPNSAPADRPRSPPPGVQQSPIDFTSPGIVPVDVSATVSVFRPGGFDGHDNNIVFASPVTLGWDGNPTYNPLGFHFHSPVEHVLPAATGTGIAPPQLEIHIKAADASGRVVVFAVQYQADRTVTAASPTLDALYDSIARNTLGYQGVSLYDTLALFQRQPFYSYVGSLTTPPCTTGVRFYVAKTPQRIPPTQMMRVLGALHATGMPDPNNRTPRQLARPAPVVTLIVPRTD